jgi:3,4-dihydroxy 2-butanone 4-phosphate synthase/GTP cyclohydrolase II
MPAGLICLTLTRERCEAVGPGAHEPAATARVMARPLPLRLKAAQGVTTGISAADRARTIEMASKARRSDIVQPGHVFPIQAVEGGVLMRAGHTEAGCDLARMAGCAPAAVICEIMNEDGTMARLPELRQFAAQHGLKIGTIADLIEHRIRNESLIRKVASRRAADGAWRICGTRLSRCARRQPAPGAGQRAIGRPTRWCRCACMSRCRCWMRWRPAANCTAGAWKTACVTSTRSNAAWWCCSTVVKAPTQLLAQFDGVLQAAHAPAAGLDLRNYGIGAQILRECGARKLHILGPAGACPAWQAMI